MEHKMNRPNMLIILHQALTIDMSVTSLLNMDKNTKGRRNNGNFQRKWLRKQQQKMAQVETFIPCGSV